MPKRQTTRLCVFRWEIGSVSLVSQQGPTQAWGFGGYGDSVDARQGGVRLRRNKQQGSHQTARGMQQNHHIVFKM